MISVIMVSPPPKLIANVQIKYEFIINFCIISKPHTHIHTYAHMYVLIPMICFLTLVWFLLQVSITVYLSKHSLIKVGFNARSALSSHPS